MNQQTLANSIETSGIGLHTGVSVNLKLKPAPENTGYIFVRTDLENFEIPASVEYISRCSYATTLLRRGVGRWMKSRKSTAYGVRPESFELSARHQKNLICQAASRPHPDP